MQCENSFCIYWDQNTCILKEIALDIQGNCQTCIYVTIEEQLLQKEREKIRRIFPED